MKELLNRIIEKITNKDEIERLKEQLSKQQSAYCKKINKLEAEVNLLRYNKVYVQNEIKGLRVIKKHKADEDKMEQLSREIANGIGDTHTAINHIHNTFKAINKKGTNEQKTIIP